MTAEDKRWDFFLAHAGADAAAAEELYNCLSPRSRVFLDSRCLLPGDDWDRELAAAQAVSRVTVVLLSERTDDAYYQREEIAAALDMARRDSSAHRVVPVYLDGPQSRESAPYGLRLKHGLDVAAEGGLAEVGGRLIELLARLQSAPISRRRVETSERSLGRLTEGSVNGRLKGIREVTGVFRPLINTLIGVLVVSLVLIGACVLAPGLEQTIDRSLAVVVLAALFTAVLATLLLVFQRSIGLARDVVHTGAVQ